MGVTVHYWAIPPRSRLYARLKEDRAFYLLMSNLFSEGNGIYALPEMVEEHPDEMEDTLQDLCERHEATLGPEPEVRRRFTEFIAEVKSTRAEYPEIEDRSTMLEKCSWEIQQRLAQALISTRPDAAEFAEKLIGGDQRFAPDVGSTDGDMLDLVSADLVREGAVVLEGLTPEALFPSDEEEWERDNYEYWRLLYLQARQHGEELLIGVA